MCSLTIEYVLLCDIECVILCDKSSGAARPVRQDAAASAYAPSRLVPRHGPSSGVRFSDRMCSLAVECVLLL